MTIYTLYIKTHKKTNLRYLGQTSKDPLKYHGSGIEWLTHLKRFGKDIDTEIILQTTSRKDLSYWGRHFSKIWNIVNSQDDFGNKIWANKIPETGGGGMIGIKQSTETIQKRVSKTIGKKRSEEFRKKIKGEGNPFYKKTHSEETKNKMSTNHKDVSGTNNPMFGKIHPNKGKKGLWKWNPESKSNVSGPNNPQWGKISPNRGKTPKKFKCPHCELSVSLSNLNRWHGTNCKKIILR
jgi:hypothetical protein